MVTLTWTPPAADSTPADPNEQISGIKEIRVLRSDVGKDNHVLAQNGILAPGTSIYQNTSYNDGDFVVVSVDNAGNQSQITRIVYPLPDKTPPPPVTNLQIAVSSTPITTTSRVDVVTVDANGADYTIVDNNPSLTTLIEWLSDPHNNVWQTLTTLGAGVTSGRLNQTWVQGTHNFVCIRATQNPGTPVTTEQQCRSLAGVFPGSPTVVQNVTINPSTIQGGGSATGTVTLNQAAGASGAVVSLSSSHPTILSVPSSVTVPSGQSSATFNVTTTNPSIDTQVTVTATLGASSVNNSATIVAFQPPPGPSGSWDNEPAGMTAVVDHDFATVSGNGLSLFAGGGTLVTNETGEPVSPNTALRETRPVGQPGGGAWLGCGFNYSSEVFVGVTYKLGSNYQGNAIGSDKILIVGNRQDAPGSGGNWYLSLYGSSGSANWGLIVQFATNDNVGNCHNNGAGGSGDCGPGTYSWPQNTGAGSIPLNQWRKIEMRLKKSTGLDTRDGVVQVWINDVLVINYQNINTGTGRFDEFNYTHAWDNAESAQTQNWDIYVGHLYVSRKT